MDDSAGGEQLGKIDDLGLGRLPVKEELEGLDGEKRSGLARVREARAKCSVPPEDSHP